MSQTFNVPRRRWGKSEISIPVIPFGTQGFGNNFGHVTDDEACELMRRSVDIGINHFDASLCYGDSQRKVGVALKSGAIKRDEIILSARICGNLTYEWNGTDFELESKNPDYSCRLRYGKYRETVGVYRNRPFRRHVYPRPGRNRAHVGKGRHV